MLYEISARKMPEILKKKYLAKSIETRASEEEALPLSIKEKTHH